MNNNILRNPFLSLNPIPLIIKIPNSHTLNSTSAGEHPLESQLTIVVFPTRSPDGRTNGRNEYMLCSKSCDEPPTNTTNSPDERMTNTKCVARWCGGVVRCHQFILFHLLHSPEVVATTSCCKQFPEHLLRRLHRFCSEKMRKFKQEMKK